MTSSAFIVVAVIVVVMAALVSAAYRRDLRRAQRALFGAKRMMTGTGPIEYAECGEGTAVLSIHGAGGGFDQGLANAAAFLGSGYRIVAPSRSGYLGTPLAPGDDPDGEASAHAALLAHLEIESAVVIGASAGARSALDLTILHPNRVRALVLVVPATLSPVDPVAIDPSPASALAFRVVNVGGDFLWWAGSRLAPLRLLRFLGVDPAVFARVGPLEQARAMRMLRELLPLSRRVHGINRDSRPDLRERDLAAIRAPTLIVAAEDDLFNTLPAARHLARAIPQAELIVYPAGGHLLLGCDFEPIRDFLGRSGRGPRD
ncbi:MAG: alpha/beta hydrolase [Phreatobacter sp.]|nr:alpha/beta hydrolase [Phreatobacter sp.]